MTGVLDWELAHLGDPVEDLGWLCVPAWRFARPDLAAAGLGTREQLLAAYARHAGVEVPIAELRWWELAGTLRWGVICVMQAFTHLSGARRSVEHAVIGRRACEVEWDLLELLDPAATSRLDPGSRRMSPAAENAPEPERARASPRQTPPERPLHDRPTAVELLDAARGALGDDVLPLLEGRAAFQLRVSLRALGMVRPRARARARSTPRCTRRRSRASASRTSASSPRAIRDGAFDGARRSCSRPCARSSARSSRSRTPRYLQT